MVDIKGVPASVVYKFFHKETSDRATKNENISNTGLAEELHKPIIRKLKNEKYTHLL